MGGIRFVVCGKEVCSAANTIKPKQKTVTNKRNHNKNRYHITNIRS